MRVTSTVAHGLLLKKIEPVYPQQAEDSHIQGMVILHVIIDTTGSVIFVKYVAGPRECMSQRRTRFGSGSIALT